MSSAEAPVLDLMGREIKAGNTVIYPVRRGSKMWQSKIVVTKVTGGKEPSLIGNNSEGRRVTVHNIVNVAVVEPLPVPSV